MPGCSGYEVDPAWIKETFGFEIGNRIVAANGNDPEDENEPEPEPKPDKDLRGKKKPAAAKKSLMLSNTAFALSYLRLALKKEYAYTCDKCKSPLFPSPGRGKTLKLAINSDDVAQSVWDNRDDKGAIDTGTHLQTANKLWDGFKEGYGTRL